MKNQYIKDHFTFNAYDYLLFVIGYFIFIIMLLNIANMFDINIKIELDKRLSLASTFLIYGLLATMTFFGIELLKSIEPLRIKSKKNILYNSKTDNKKFELIANNINLDLEKSQGLIRVIRTFFISSIIFMSIRYIINLNDQNIFETYEIIISGLLVAILFFLFYPIHMIPILYAFASVKLWDMPKENFNIDIYHPSGQSNVEDIMNLINAGLAYNATYYMAVWFFIPLAFIKELHESPIAIFLYLVIGFFILLPRVRSYRMFRRAKIGLKKSILEAIDHEKEILNSTSIDFEERTKKYDHLTQLSTYPTINHKTKEQMKNFIIWFIFPIILLLIELRYGS